MSDILPAPGDPMGVARILIEDHQIDGELTLRHWRGGWMRWQGTHWREVEPKAIRSWLYMRLEEADYWHVQPATTRSEERKELRAWNPNRHKVADVTDALAAVTHTDEAADTPSWLPLARAGNAQGTRNPGSETSYPQGQERAGTHGTRISTYCAEEIVSCSNGLLHVTTKHLGGHTPSFWNTVAVPFDYDPGAPKPAKWLAFLGELWPDDPDSIKLLQEWFGYVLSGRTDMQKILLKVGPKRSGKGTIARILEQLLGRGNAAAPTLASLATNFGLAPLVGKPLAVVGDARLAGPNVFQVVERLLSISGEDLLTVDRKYRDPWTGKLPSRFVLLSNELPSFGDASGAIASRFVVLVLTQSFLGRENTRLIEELTSELPAILSWALDGLGRLTQQGRFTEPKSSTDAILALQDLVSPIAAFVRDRCEVGVGLEVKVSDLFAAWKEWAEENGHKAGSVQALGKNIRAAVPLVRQVQPRDGDHRERRYVGIRLRTTTDHNGDSRVPPRSTPTTCVPLHPGLCTKNPNCRTFNSCCETEES